LRINYGSANIFTSIFNSAKLVMEEKPSDDYAPVPRHKDESVKMNLAGYREDTEAFVLTLADMDFAFSNVVRKEITRRI
jgi:hypothetical protein